jgi:hypothetical protein
MGRGIAARALMVVAHRDYWLGGLVAPSELAARRNRRTARIGSLRKTCGSGNGTLANPVWLFGAFLGAPHRLARSDLCTDVRPEE